MPGSPRLSMAKDIPGLEIVELLLRLEVVSRVITVGEPQRRVMGTVAALLEDSAEVDSVSHSGP